jgi:hypothetical protein
MSEEAVYQRPAPKADYIDVQIHKEDLATLIELIDSTVAFYTMASNSVVGSGDENTEAVFRTRIKLLNAFNSRFKTNLLIGEPESRDEH